MERNPETVRQMLLGLHRLGRRILDERRESSDVLFLPIGETAIGDCDDDVRYRGYRVAELLRHATFPEVAHLLLEGDLPSSEFLADFQSLLVDLAEIPPAVERLRNEIPLHVGDGEALRALLTTLAVFDPQVDDDAITCGVGKATRLLATAPLLLGARCRIRDGADPVPASDHHSYAASVFQQMTGEEPSPAAERAFEALLIVLAEESRDPATLAARVTASNGGDVYAAVTAAVCACDTRIGNDVCRRVLELFDAATIGSVAEAVEEAGPGRPPIGFGLVDEIDPRVEVLGELVTELAVETGADRREELARELERHVFDTCGGRPLLAWPVARLLDLLGLDAESFGPLLVIARIAGWTAHAVEESALRRRLSGRGIYVGPAVRAV